MLNKKKVKKIFNDNKIQLPKETLVFLDSEIERMVNKWAKKCKSYNIKRLSIDLIGYIFPKTSNK
jgi:hypothetical protein